MNRAIGFAILLIFSALAQAAITSFALYKKANYYSYDMKQMLAPLDMAWGRGLEGFVFMLLFGIGCAIAFGRTHKIGIGDIGLVAMLGALIQFIIPFPFILVSRLVSFGSTGNLIAQMTVYAFFLNLVVHAGFNFRIRMFPIVLLSLIAGGAFYFGGGNPFAMYWYLFVGLLISIAAVSSE
jgi:hypothetical protein